MVVLQILPPEKWLVSLLYSRNNLVWTPWDKMRTHGYLESSPNSVCVFSSQAIFSWPGVFHCLMVPDLEGFSWPDGSVFLIFCSD